MTDPGSAHRYCEVRRRTELVRDGAANVSKCSIFFTSKDVDHQIGQPCWFVEPASECITRLCRLIDNDRDEKNKLEPQDWHDSASCSMLWTFCGSCGRK